MLNKRLSFSVKKCGGEQNSTKKADSRTPQMG